MFKKLLFANAFVAMMMAMSAQAADVETVPFVDLNKYIGKWYEVASIPQSFQKQCVGNTVAEYSLVSNGQVKVLNSCDTASGKRSIAEGRAKLLDTKTNSKLKVTFVKLIDWIFTFGGNYWILDLPEDYSYAVVGDPTREYAWILSRVPNVSLETLAKAETKLKAQGYDTCKVLTSVQSTGFKERLPLCEVVKKAQDVVDILVNKGNFKTYLAALQLAGVEGDIRTSGAVTLIVPSDEVLATLGEEKINQIFSDLKSVTAFANSFAVNGNYKVLDLLKLGVVQNLQGQPLYIKIEAGNKVTVNGALVANKDIQAKNGVIQVLGSLPQ